jgi:Fe-S-cluster-containing dehydrogenase component/formate-dependent nitrite reductase membrane component NrfD
LRYGFVIDHNRCIGCHACTVACKEEHNVPIGVFRTWVKYIEKGEFPETRRHFGVMRCNHCDNAPCVEICPTKALHYRDNGIVDFDNRRCIGCKSCMQACPYDALYIDPNTNTAAKCNFCAHRIELKLEPACVVVCPTRAIIAGDLDNSRSAISTIVATQKVAARKPHKGTQPKLFYAGIEGDFLQPSMMLAQSSHVFADHNPAAELTGYPADANSVIGAARVAYDVAHHRPWDVLSAIYLWTKSIGGGVLLVAAVIAGLISPRDVSRTILFGIASPLAALILITITTAVLIGHLKRPDRFYYILIKPNPRSWLVWGTWILMAYGAAAAAWLLFGLMGEAAPGLLIAIAALAGAASAVYSAFLFSQAKGRDLWQSPLLLWILLAQAFCGGSAVLLIMSYAVGVPVGSALSAPLPDFRFVFEIFLCTSVIGHLLMILTQVSLPEYTTEVRMAIAAMVHGVRGAFFWWGLVIACSIIPVVLLSWELAGSGPIAVADLSAASLALAGLLIFDETWIAAGQIPPNS